MRQKPASSKFALAFSVGGILTSNLLGGCLLGYFLDRWLRTSPWLMLVGLVLGTISAFWRLYRIMLELKD
jgi:ATP synthase protein I